MIPSDPPRDPRALGSPLWTLPRSAKHSLGLDSGDLLAALIRVKRFASRSRARSLSSSVWRGIRIVQLVGEAAPKGKERIELICGSLGRAPQLRFPRDRSVTPRKRTPRRRHVAHGDIGHRANRRNRLRIRQAMRCVTGKEGAPGTAEERPLGSAKERRRCPQLPVTTCNYL